LHGRINNLEYGSNAPEAPHVFLDEKEFVDIWKSPKRCYLLVHGTELQQIGQWANETSMIVVQKNADDYLLTNHIF